MADNLKPKAESSKLQLWGRHLLYCLLIALPPLLCGIVPASADTVYLRDGSEKKGIVVENYHDRIILSTFEGEQEIGEKDIEDIEYDRLEQNLVKLGDLSWQKDETLKAYGYYEKAYYLNPEYKEAKDKFLHLRAALLERPEKKIRSDVERRRRIFMEAGKVYEPKENNNRPKTMEERFLEITGLALVREGEIPKVKLVAAESPACKSGIKTGDLIYSVWGRLAGYLDIDDIITMIIDSASSEVSLVIKRDVKMPTRPDREGTAERLGVSLDIDEEGLFISGVSDNSLAKKYGLEEKDIITEIGEERTRYMPMDKAVQLINKQASQGEVELSFLREVMLWKEV